MQGSGAVDVPAGDLTATKAAVPSPPDDPMSPRGTEQGPNGIEEHGEEEAPGASGSGLSGQLATSRRGGDSLRSRTLDALLEARWPAFPEAACSSGGEAGFELPRALIDKDAPLSARKWDMALSLADAAGQLTAKRRRDAAAAPSELAAAVWTCA